MNLMLKTSLLVGCLLMPSAAFGQTAPTSRMVEPAARFVPDGRRLNSSTAELRAEAAVYSETVSFKQIARWSDTDAPALQPLSDIVIAQLPEKTGFMTISVAQVKAALVEAGINEAMIRFTGATTCTVKRADAKFDESDALSQWIGREVAPKSVTFSDEIPAADVPETLTRVVVPESSSRETAAATIGSPGQVESKLRTLRSLLVDDISNRLGIARDQLQLTFKSTDEKLLNLPEGQFRFNIEGQRVKTLGAVRWDVTVITENGQHKASVGATARAWQDEVVVAKPMVVKQVIRAEDLTTRRVLTDETSLDTVLSMSQVVGQQASRDLRPGVVMTARLVDAVPMVKPGQLVSLTIGQGAIRVKTVARAMEPGTFGQTIKVKNETTRDIYDVTVTGPQAASVGDVSQLQTTATN